MLSWLDAVLKSNVEQYHLLAIYITMTLESSCIPIPSEIVMPYAGHLVALGRITMLQATVVAGLANLSGSWLAYAVGRFGGRGFIKKYGKYVFLSENHLNQADRWFATKGDVTVFFSRMLPAVRTFISLPAGIARMDIVKFSLYSFIGSLPWNFALVYLGFTFSNNWDALQQLLHQFNVVAYAGLILAVVAFFVYRRKRK